MAGFARQTAPLSARISVDEAPLVGVPIVDHRALQIDYWKLRRELSRRPQRHYQPQPCDAWDDECC